MPFVDVAPLGAPNGSAPSGNPTLIAGSDGTAVRNIRTDANGNVYTSAILQNFAGSGVNLWNATAVLAAGTSTAVGVYYQRSWIISGNTNAATTLTVQVSYDTITWRNTSVSVVMAGAGDFSIDCRALFGATYVRLISSAAATITAGVMGVY